MSVAFSSFSKYRPLEPAFPSASSWSRGLGTKWEDLKSGDPVNEMIKLKFIEGLKDEGMKVKVLGQIQASSTKSHTDIVDFCQLYAQMSSFVGAENSQTK